MSTVTQARSSNRTVLRLLSSPLHPLLSRRVCELSYGVFADPAHTGALKVLVTRT